VCNAAARSRLIDRGATRPFQSPEGDLRCATRKYGIFAYRAAFADVSVPRRGFEVCNALMSGDQRWSDGELRARFSPPKGI
jgi:hypothetical protein